MKNLLKKLTAVFVVVAMVSSLGIVAFAANPGAYVPDDNSVKITDIDCVASTTVTGLYNVTVKCEVADDALDKNAIGVTMLTYAKKNENLGATDSEYDAYDEDSMQIVGIDQKQREDGVNAVEFKFAVTTVDADTNAYAVQPGKSAVILVSGDGLNPAAGLLTIPVEKTNATAASATVAYDGSVDVYSYDTVATVLETLKASFEATTATVLNAEGAEIGTVALEADYINSVAKGDGVYAATAVIPSTATVESEEYDVVIPAAGLTVIFNVEANAAAWEADTVSYTFDTAQNIAAASIVSEDDLKNLFVGKTVEVSNAAVDAAKATVAITADMIVGDDANPADFAVGGVFNYTIVLPDTDDYVIVSADKEIAVTVTIVDTPAALKGDANGDGFIMADDITTLVNHIAGTEIIEDATALYAADANGDGFVMADDITTLVNHIAGTELIVQP